MPGAQAEPATKDTRPRYGQSGNPELSRGAAMCCHGLQASRPGVNAKGVGYVARERRGPRAPPRKPRVCHTCSKAIRPASALLRTQIAPAIQILADVPAAECDRTDTCLMIHQGLTTSFGCYVLGSAMVAEPAFTRRLLLGHGFGAALLLPGAAVAGNPRASRHSAPTKSAPLVVLDPGHGGKDPGAIGVSGTYEKHIAFAAAGELARLLRAHGRYRVSLTRENDVFIPLEDRVAIAQAHGASLFISMHADAVADHSVRGASVYTLADAASDAQTAQLAAHENAADRYGGPASSGVSPQVAMILASLVRHETRVGSAHMQTHIVTALGRDLPLLDNPARHAGFAVLKAADIPSVLVEMGFMSNPADEAALRQVSHRAMIASAIGRAVDGYFASSGQLTRIG